MAAINHGYAEQNPQQSTTSTTPVDALSSASMTGFSFTAGKKYLIVATANVASSSSTSHHRPQVRVVHGSTEFADSVRFCTPPLANIFSPYVWFHVWEAVSGEDIKIQFNSGNAASTAYLDEITLLAINLSDDLTENTDWRFNELATDSPTLSTESATDGATLTFTPGTSGHKWLVLALAQINATSAAMSLASRLVRSGEASQSSPETIVEPFNGTNHQDLIVSPCVFTLGAASNTFTEQSLVYATSPPSSAHTRLHSKIFALDLDKFETPGFQYDEADTGDLSATAFGTTVQTLSYTPATAGDVWIGGFWVHDKGAAPDCNWRLQVDNADQPPSQTTNAYTMRRGQDARDEDGFFTQTVESLTAAAHTIDLDASNVGGSVQTAQHRLIWAVSMELAADTPVSFSTPAIGTQNAPVGQVFSLNVATAGGVTGSHTPFTYSSVGTALPAWASLNTSTGVISGTPTSGDTGTTSGIIIRATDSDSPANTDDTDAFAITVNAASRAVISVALGLGF